jgi:hypothetical protein
VEGETMGEEWTGTGDPPPPSRPGRWARARTRRAAAVADQRGGGNMKPYGFQGSLCAFIATKVSAGWYGPWAGPKI